MAREGNQKHSVTIRGHRTSITLEPAFWDSLKEIAAIQKKSVSDIIVEADAKDTKNLSSTLRLFVLNYYKNKA